MIVNGYQTFTTFWEDFSIADAFGLDAIQDTFDRAFNEWKSDYKYLTELVMILNWKIWCYYGSDKQAYADLYDKLWTQADTYACENLKDKELAYFYQVTD